jgi:pre-mRNA-splicing factor SPF27
MSSSQILADARARVQDLTLDALPAVDEEVSGCCNQYFIARASVLTKAIMTSLSILQINEPGMRDVVNGLILEEMSRFEPPDYLSNTPLGAAISSATEVRSELIRAELERISRGEAMQKLDVSGYDRISAPSGSAAEDPEAWTSAVRRAEVAAEALSLRAINVELMSKYGPDAWKAHVSDVEKLSNAARSRADAAAASCAVVNEERRVAQEPYARRLQTLTRKWATAVDSNFQIELACVDADREVKRLRRAVQEKETGAQQAQNDSAAVDV